MAPEERAKAHVITRYRDANSNLRTQLERIIGKAKLKPWPKLFQNLRATRATELAAEFPAHVAAEWLGHSTMVAQKHYWRVTDADFEKATAVQALQNPVQLGAASTGNDECEGELITAFSEFPKNQGSNQHARQDSNLRPAD